MQEIIAIQHEVFQKKQERTDLKSFDETRATLKWNHMKTSQEEMLQSSTTCNIDIPIIYKILKNQIISMGKRYDDWLKFISGM